MTLSYTTLVITNIITFSLLAFIFSNYAHLFRDQFQRAVFWNWKIKKVNLNQFDDAFRLTDEFGETLDASVQFMARLSERAGVSDREAWVLSVMAKKSKHIFEFGTASGKTTYLMAQNAPEDATVTTLTLHPDQITDVVQTKTDSNNMTKQAIAESWRTSFFYEDTPSSHKVTQLFMDSKSLDESQYNRQYDMIFIDGSHMYSYVESDTQKALKMIKPGGVIFWHDYCGPMRAPDVYKYLNLKRDELNLVHLEGTHLVAYRHN